MLIIALVFLAVFTLVMVIAFAFQAEPGGNRKLTASRLAAIPTNVGFVEPDQLKDVLIDDALSAVPWLNDLLAKSDMMSRLQNLLLQADSRWTVARLLTYCFLAALGGFFLVYWRTGDLFPGIVLGSLAACIPPANVLRLRAARMAKFEQRLPDALEMMVSAIRAGHSLLSALGTAARELPPPISTEFRKCYDEQNFGLDLRVAMENLAIRMPLHDVQIIVTAVLIQRDSGGNLAEILERVAQVIRDRFRLKRQIRTHTAQGRLTGAILALLPPILGFLIYLVNPEYMSKLWENPLGMKLLYVSAVMTAIGGLIIRKIINVRI